MKQYEKSVTSQWGEDGVIERIFSIIGEESRVAVEIGAWDGKHLSNTWALAQKGWRRILAESDADKLKNWFSNKNDNDELFGHVYDIDTMLDHFDLPNGIDLISIDVDGDDYYLWEAMRGHKPRVVIIEYNQTVPLHISIVQHRGGSFGASAKALMDLAAKKGYTLAHATVTNLIFILDAEYYRHFTGMSRHDLHPEIEIEWNQYIVTGYNGKQYLIGEPAHKDDQGGKHEKLISNVSYKPL